MRQIARIIDCSFSTVRRIIQLYEETRDVIERGRNRLIVDPVRQSFRQIMSQHPTDTSSSIANRLEQRARVRVSDRTKGEKAIPTFPAFPSIPCIPIHSGAPKIIIIIF